MNPSKLRKKSPFSFCWKALTFCIAFIALLSAPAQASVTLRISCGSVGMERELCDTAVKQWEEKTGHTVIMVSSPKDATNRLSFFQQILSAGSSDVDVFQIDVIWPGILSQHLLDLTSYFKEEELQDFFPIALANNTINQRLVAIPWFMETGLLFYRKDLLEKYSFNPPETWQELTTTAAYIQEAERKAGQSNLWGYLFQGRAYEGLTCNALEWIDSFKGGTIVNEQGKITIDNANAIAALEMARGWIGTISPQGVLNYAEEEVRLSFLSGNSIFMRNWPYVFSSIDAPNSIVSGKVGYTQLPRGENGKHTGILGGHHLAVSRYSNHPKEAVELVKFLTDTAEQRHRALVGAMPPSRMALYEETELQNKSPHLAYLYEVFIESAISRPANITGLRYNQVSYEFWNATHDVLTGRRSADAALQNLTTNLQRISRNGAW